MLKQNTLDWMVHATNTYYLLLWKPNTYYSLLWKSVFQFEDDQKEVLSYSVKWVEGSLKSKEMNPFVKSTSSFPNYLFKFFLFKRIKEL